MENKVCQLISLISTGARNYVQDGFINQTVTLVHYEESQDTHGVFCVVENEECVIAYAAFPRYRHEETLINLMTKKLKRYLELSETREVCFNIYGRNEEIIQFARKLGFATDMEGFQLQYDFSKENKALELAPLVEKGFSSVMLNEFIQLFDKAYYDVKVENGWSTEPPVKEAFLQSMLSYESEARVRSFWLEDTLIGAYCIDGEFIRDFVILPNYQNRGYGSRMLNNCIQRMTKQMGRKTILLRVAKTNSGAKRFYERNGFIELSIFAEHTFFSR